MIMLLYVSLHKSDLEADSIGFEGLDSHVVKGQSG
jgi:hypothetical protein